MVDIEIVANSELFTETAPPTIGGDVKSVNSNDNLTQAGAKKRHIGHDVSKSKKIHLMTMMI